MRNAQFTLVLVVLLACLSGCARTTLKFLSSDTNSVTHVRLEDYNLREVKRGLFLGICPSTSQLQWSYYISLAGPGPDYSPEQVRLEEGGSGDKLKIVSGQ